MEYGRTLIGLTCQKGSTMELLPGAANMTESKKGIQERIGLIVKRPKTALYRLAVLLIVLAVTVGGTFTGAISGEGQAAGTPDIKDIFGVSWGWSSWRVKTTKTLHADIWRYTASPGKYDSTVVFYKNFYGWAGSAGYNFNNDKLMNVTYHFKTKSYETFSEAFEEIESSLSSEYGEATKYESQSSDDQNYLYWVNEHTHIEMDIGTAVAQWPNTSSLYYITVYFEPSEKLKTDIDTHIIKL